MQLLYQLEIFPALSVTVKDMRKPSLQLCQSLLSEGAIWGGFFCCFLIIFLSQEGLFFDCNLEKMLSHCLQGFI